MFRQQMSTKNTIFSALFQVYKSLDDGASVVGIQFDLRKAFDRVKLLLTNMESCGIRGVVLNLFRSYIDTNRCQATRVTVLEKHLHLIMLPFSVWFFKDQFWDLLYTYCMLMT